MRTLASLLLFVVPFFAAAQDRKPGLYELTITTTTVSPQARAHPPRTSLACLTPDMIEKYGAIVPDDLTNVCQLTNTVKKIGGMTANVVCSGAINGKGTLEVNWVDGEHTRGILHFTGTMRPVDSDVKIEWSVVTTSVYKGPDCGPAKVPDP